jgi:prevent-host-death family protein
MKRYQLQDAKAHLSEFVTKVAEHGPYVITVHGKEKAALVSIDVFDKMYPSAKEPLLEFFRKSPLRGSDLKVQRDKAPMRKVEL